MDVDEYIEKNIHKEKLARVGPEEELLFQVRVPFTLRSEEVVLNREKIEREDLMVFETEGEKTYKGDIGQYFPFGIKLETSENMKKIAVSKLKNRVHEVIDEGKIEQDVIGFCSDKECDGHKVGKKTYEIGNFIDRDNRNSCEDIDLNIFDDIFGEQIFYDKTVKDEVSIWKGIENGIWIYVEGKGLKHLPVYRFKEIFEMDENE